MTENEQIEDDFEPIKSKTQIKAEMAALQVLGQKLTLLKPAQLAEVPLGEDLIHAIKESYNITQREAKRRHLHYIGKLMRKEDAEAIQYAIDQFDSSSKRFAQEIHRVENWRDRLITQGKTALTEFIESHPGVDVQQLRQLVRNAQKDLSHNKNTGAAKKLFRFIREL